jgi:co-chaperonin GroES (HSP10)
MKNGYLQQQVISRREILQAKLFKTSLAEFEVATYDGNNTSGWAPVGDRLIICPDSVASKTRGGVELPDDLRDRMTMAAEAGVVVAVGEGCFVNEANGMPFLGRKPVTGDRVSVHRYSGQLIMGHDGKSYRILSSSEVGAIQVEESSNVH